MKPQRTKADKLIIILQERCDENVVKMASDALCDAYEIGLADGRHMECKEIIRLLAKRDKDRTPDNERA